MEGPGSPGDGGSLDPPPKAFRPLQVSQATGMCGGGLQPTSCQQLEEELWDLSRLGEGGFGQLGRPKPPGEVPVWPLLFPSLSQPRMSQPVPSPKKKKKQQQEPRIFLLQLDRGCFPMAFWDSGTGVGHRPPCWEARRWDTDICSTPMDTGLLLPDVVSTGSGSGCQHPAGLLDAVLPYVPCNPPGNWGVEPNSGSNPPISPNARGRSLENPNPIRVWEKFFLLGRGRESPTLCALGHGQEPGPPPVYATAGPT